MIGFVRTNDKHDNVIRLLAQFAYARKVDFCYFDLNNARPCMEGKPLLAKRWNGDCFETFVTNLPKFVDQISAIRGFSAQQVYGPDLCKWVSANTKILSSKSFHKDQLMVAMICNGLGQYAIPSYIVYNYRDILENIRMTHPALIKPVRGKQGRLVYKLYEKNGKLFAEDRFGLQEFTEDFSDHYFKEINESFPGDVILQPFLDFRFDSDRVIDFRLLRMRGVDGSWEDVATFGRIGSNAVTANFHTGGSMIEADMALNLISPEHADELYDELMMLGQKLPKMADKYFGEKTFCIGFDIAIDRTSLRPYVIESNLTPGLRFIEYQYADHRVNYYKYLLSK